MQRNVKTKEEFDIKGLVIIVIVLALIVLALYFLTVGAQKIGLFDEHYEKQPVSNAVISYENSLAGSIFSKPDKEYYVIIADFTQDDSVYLNGMARQYKDKEGSLPIYAVDLSNEMNKSIVADTNNPSAQNVQSMKVKDYALIKISNGRNVKYVIGEDNIKKELGV